MPWSSTLLSRRISAAAEAQWVPTPGGGEGRNHLHLLPRTYDTKAYFKQNRQALD